MIHLEPPHGDDAREYGPFAGEPGKNRNGYFISLNRNKKSLVFNLKLDGGREVLREVLGYTTERIEALKAEGGTAVGRFGFVKFTKAMDMNLQKPRL